MECIRRWKVYRNVSERLMFRKDELKKLGRFLKKNVCVVKIWKETCDGLSIKEEMYL